MESSTMDKKRKYPPESAGSLACTEIVTVDPEENLGVAEEQLRSNDHSLEELHYLYVVDDKGVLKGVLSVRDLFSYPSDTKAGEIMTEQVVSVSPDTDQERAAAVALEEQVKAMPVVDENGVLIGVIPVNTIFKILSQEHEEDLLYMGGVEMTNSAEGVLNARLSSLLTARLPWLIVGLAGGLVAAMVVERFETVLEHYLALAFFLPLVVYMSDAVANQTLTIFIRAMAINNDFSIRRYIVRELTVGGCIGAVIGVLIYLISYVWFWDWEVSFILGTSLFLAIIIAVTIALLMTLGLFWLKKDPAPGSGPFATIIIDVTTIILYFLIASGLHASLA